MAPDAAQGSLDVCAGYCWRSVCFLDVVEKDRRIFRWLHDRKPCRDNSRDAAKAEILSMDGGLEPGGGPYVRA